MTARLPQGEATIARMCMLAGVSRAGYYRHWAASAPRQEETGVRDAIQRLALAHPHYGYRPDRGAAASRRLGCEPQKGAAPDARRQSAVPEEASLRSGDN